MQSLINEYLLKFPKVEIEVSIEEKISNFKIQEADLIFGVNWEPPEDIVARKIAQTKYVLCATPEYLRSNGSLNNLDELQKYNYIKHKSRPTSLVALKGKSRHIKVNSSLSANNADFIKQCVLLSMGVAQLHEYMVVDEIKEGKLVSLLEDEFIDSQDIFIYYQKNKFVQPKVKEFVELVVNAEILL